MMRRLRAGLSGGALQDRFFAAILFALCVLYAARLGADANWDMRNYHLYNPMALLRGRWQQDFAPAQIQSFHIPTLDIPFYVLTRHLRPVWLLNAVLALPQALAVALSFVLALRFAPVRNTAWRCIAALAVLLGATGAATMPVIATSMSDMPAVVLILSALLLLLPHGALAATPRRCFGAGLLVGVALGLKLTLAYMAVGIAIGLFVHAGSIARRCGRVVLLGAGSVLGLLASAGWWYMRMAQQWGQPLFPYFNNIFHAPLVPPLPFNDPTFLPHGWRQAASYPFLLAAAPTRFMSELPVRDARFLLALAMSALLLVCPRRWVASGPRFIAIIMLVGFALWEKQFSILRYLSGLELLIGPLWVACLVLVLTRIRAGRIAKLLASGAATACALAAFTAWTVYPDFQRMPRGQALTVFLPPIPPDALVLMLDPSPMAYIALAAPPGMRFVGANNNLVNIQDPRFADLQRKIAGIIAATPGPIWGAAMPVATSGWRDLTAKFYGLRRTDECYNVESNADYNMVQLCRLERLP